MTARADDGSVPPQTTGRPSSDRSGLLRIAPVGTFGRYQILGRIALGGMAEIFLARQRAEAGASRTLVIKRVLPHVADDERFVQMFLDEARLAMKLTHPNICHIYEFGQQRGSYFIAMEWVDGMPLGRLIKTARKQYGAVPPGISARIIATTAEALDYAHHARDDDGRALAVIHRDVSPQNIMVSYQGVVKLLDFGIAKAASHLAKTSDGQVKGKFAYMSPEQCRGEEIDGRSDVFALGICLYEALTARNLYKRNTEYETFRAIIEAPVPSAREQNPDVPEALDRIMMTALQKEPDDRYPTAGAMQRALEGWLAETRQVINASTTSQLMGLLFADDIQTGPSVEPVPFGGGTLDADEEMSAAPPERQSVLPVALLGVLVVLLSLVVAAGGVWIFTRPETMSDLPAPTDRPQDERQDERQDDHLLADGDEDAPGVAASDPEIGDIAPVGIGSLRVVTRPAGASVELDGEPLESVTPLDVDTLTEGAHPVVIRLEGRRTHRDVIEIVAGEQAVIETRLGRRRRGERDTTEPDMAMAEATLADRGTLAINTRPWSKVYVGSRLLGTTPLRTTVPTGTLRLRLEDRDGQTHERTVRVSEDEEARVFFDLAE